MHFRIVAAFAAYCVLVGSPGASTAQQVGDNEQACLRIGANVAQRVEKLYRDSQVSQSRSWAAELIAVACGVSKRAVEKVSGMGCSSEVVEVMTGLYDHARNTLITANAARGEVLECSATDEQWDAALTND